MEWVIIAVVLVVVAIAAVVGYVVPRRRRGVEPTVEAPTLERAEAAPSATEAETVPEVAAEPVVETPEPTAGRLVRLRSRLSRSQSTLGKGLLALLSRDRLDDDTWEEIEDSLITADVGVGATGEIVSRLREQTRVLGTRSAAELRELLSAELINAIGAD